MTERQAFDLRLYRNKPSAAFTDDLRALATETCPQAAKRITPFEYLLDGQIIWAVDNQGNRFNLLSFLSYDHHLDRQSSRATLEIRERLLSQESTAYCWLSPPDNTGAWPEARLTIGLREKGRNKVKNYGLCLGLSQSECLDLAQSLWSCPQADNSQAPSDCDLLRQTPLFLNFSDWSQFLDFLEGKINAPEMIQAIRCSAVNRFRDLATRAAQAVTREIFPQLHNARTRLEFLQLGALAEQMMQNLMGFRFLSTSGCGASNTDLLQKFFTLPGLTATSINSRGEKFVKKCPYCGRLINSFISSGYTCTCGQVYKGVC